MNTRVNITLAAVLAGLTLTTTFVNAAVVAITGVTASHGGDSHANGLISLIDGSGIDKTASAWDPSQWVNNTDQTYGYEWMGDFFPITEPLNPATNDKLAWVSFDLGASTAKLETLHLFNIVYGGGVAGVFKFNLYYADNPTIALPAMPNKGDTAKTGKDPNGDYDFSSAGWTLLSSPSTPETLAKSSYGSVALGGISARYLAVEILTNHGGTYGGGRVGFSEVAITTAGPEPSTAGPESSTSALLGLGGITLILR
jgi:hypothetical protein